MTAPTVACPNCAATMQQGLRVTFMAAASVLYCPACWTEQPAPSDAEQAAAALRDSLSPMAARNRRWT